MGERLSPHRAQQALFSAALPKRFFRRVSKGSQRKGFGNPWTARSACTGPSGFEYPHRISATILTKPRIDGGELQVETLWGQRVKLPEAFGALQSSSLHRVTPVTAASAWPVFGSEHGPR